MIREIKGDLWALHAQGHRIVITTNIGWDPVSLRNNMGAGVALQAGIKYPRLPRWYGATCKRLKHHTPVIVYPRDERIILLPVKPLLDVNNPERSWDQVASLELIEKGLRQLLALPGTIALSTPGAGNGKLPEDVVAALVRRVLNTDPNPRRFVLVQYKPNPKVAPQWRSVVPWNEYDSLAGARSGELGIDVTHAGGHGFGIVRCHCPGCRGEPTPLSFGARQLELEKLDTMHRGLAHELAGRLQWLVHGPSPEPNKATACGLEWPVAANIADAATPQDVNCAQCKRALEPEAFA